MRSSPRVATPRTSTVTGSTWERTSRMRPCTRSLGLTGPPWSAACFGSSGTPSYWRGASTRPQVGPAGEWSSGRTTRTRGPPVVRDRANTSVPRGVALHRVLGGPRSAGGPPSVRRPRSRRSEAEARPARPGRQLRSRHDPRLRHGGHDPVRPPLRASVPGYRTRRCDRGGGRRVRVGGHPDRRGGVRTIGGTRCQHCEQLLGLPTQKVWAVRIRTPRL